MARANRSVIWSATAVVVVAAMVYLAMGDQPVKPLGAKTTSRKSASTKVALFTPEDYKARYEPVKTGARNIFVPLVARSATGGAGGATGPAMIPPELTMGEVNWVYSGMAEVDTVPSALVENTSTQQGAFLKQGERWKQATILQITPEALTLVGPDGLHHIVKVQGSQDQLPTSPAAGGFRPLAVNPQPGLRGPIGGGAIEIQPQGGGNRTQGVTNVPNIN